MIYARYIINLCIFIYFSHLAACWRTAYKASVCLFLVHYKRRTILVTLCVFIRISNLSLSIIPP